MRATNTLLYTALAATFLLGGTREVMAAVAEHATLQGSYVTVAEVTVACLACHPQAGTDILQSTHWTWQRQRLIDGKEVRFSKLDALTTFGISPTANPDRCLGCHISITPSAELLATADAGAIDCLVCHDTTGTYRRQQAMKPMQLLHIARNVGPPAPANCMTCHNPSCGLGKHRRQSDLADDIHLQRDGAGLTCQSCHPAAGHHILARKRASQTGPTRTTGCRSCHTDTPHRLNQLNRHAELIACQTCHIPDYGRVGGTILSWNWLMSRKMAGLYKEGSTRKNLPLLTADGFMLASHIQPVYRWDNGSDLIYRRGDRIDPTMATILQQPGPRTPASRIHPFTVRYGTQLFDARYRYLVSPQLATDSPAMFPDTDWETIARAGMHSIRLPYSGQHDFTTTLTYHRLGHGTVAAALALDCMDCHGRNGRMDWKALGYEQDPWTDAEMRQTPRTIVPGQENVSFPGKELPPVRETILPVETDR